jgi:hypothetical protein
MRPFNADRPALAICGKNGRHAAVAAVGVGAIIKATVNELDFERHSAVFT